MKCYLQKGGHKKFNYNVTILFSATKTEMIFLHLCLKVKFQIDHLTLTCIQLIHNLKWQWSTFLFSHVKWSREKSIWEIDLVWHHWEVNQTITCSFLNTNICQAWGGFSSFNVNLLQIRWQCRVQCVCLK